ncbi:MAG: hypothetical protein K0V04_03915 [Deltaproteobacteria bacterium]|nr:hypothetical protein [Deltaproteobacteria bacterium]
MTRGVHLVGSMPFENEEAAMAKALDIAGERLVVALPDGEIGQKSASYPCGERASWVQVIIDRCQRDTAHWKVTRHSQLGESGFPASYDAAPRLTPKVSPKTMHEHLDFGWLDAFRSSYPVFKRLRERKNLPALKFQVGLPTGMGVTFAMMSPVNAMRYASAFARRMAFEANAILDEADPGDIAFQVEVPGELTLAYRLPRWLHRIAVGGVVDLLKQVRPEAPFGVHLCFGDLNNEALIRAGSLIPAVNFANTLISRWPASHELAYVHFPLAEAASPPSMDPAHYAPLGDLKLPPGVRFVAGFVHERIDMDEHRRLLEIVEGARGGPVDVASSCGLGRRSSNVAQKLIETATHLAEAAPPS